MIVIDIDPMLARIGPLNISWHGLFTAVGILVAVVLAARLARRTGFAEDHVYGLALWAVPAGVVGARLFHVVDEFGYYAAHPLAILAIQEGGLAIYGGLAGGILGGVLYLARHGLPLGRFADAVAPAIILGQAIGRIGDVIDGEHHGAPADLPWSVVYVHSNTAGEQGLAVHPSVGYEMLWDLAVFAVLLGLRDRLPRAGMLFWTYVVLYALGRFVVGFFRTDTMLLGGLGQAQLIAVISLLVTILVLAAPSLRRGKVAGATA
ncbi:MAG: prolipoprotein diacylglyceryl transferase [Chloroflexota bacterium]|nr:MAG: prolipoprotein diacylglyceryl transferase [Chloroflexota bacterium]